MSNVTSSEPEPCPMFNIVESGGNYSPAANFLTRTTSTWGCTQHNANNDQQHHTMPNQTVPFNTIPFNTMLQNTTPYHGAIRQVCTFGIFHNFHLGVPVRGEVGGLEVFTPPLLQSIHTVSILLMDRFYTFCYTF